MNLKNPLQIAQELKLEPILVTSLIRAFKIKSQKQGLRGGLYDVDEVRSALEKTQPVKE